jgi:anti-sigma factor RsiW
MSHSPYDSWLFSDEPLPAREAEDLRRHLASCDHCRALQAAWGEARLDLTRLPAEAPSPGFSRRWEARRSLDHRRRARRQSTALLAALGASLTGAVLGCAWLGICSPLRWLDVGDLLSGGVRWMANTSVLYYVARQVLSSLAGPISPVAILGGGGLVTAAAAGLVGAWVLVVYQIHWSQAQKGAQR